MRIEDCFYLGTITRKHGKDGGLILKLETDQPENYYKMESVLLEIDGELVPFFISDITIQPNGKSRVEFEDINSTQEAKRIVGKKLFLPLAVLPKLTGNHFYHHEIEDYQLIDQSETPIGSIKEIQDSPAQDLIVVVNNGKELLIPILEDTIIKLNRKEKTLKVNIQEGLLDLFI